MMDAQALSRLMREAPAVNSVHLSFDESRLDALYDALKGIPTASGMALQSASLANFQAALGAADAAVGFAEHEVQRIEAALEFAQGELERALALARRDVIATKALDNARVDVETNGHALASAKAQLAVRRGERASIAARLIDPSTDSAPKDVAWSIQLRAPVSGRILKIHQESEAVVPAGTPLIDIGDPHEQPTLRVLSGTHRDREC